MNKKEIKTLLNLLSRFRSEHYGYESAPEIDAAVETILTLSAAEE